MAFVCAFSSAFSSAFAICTGAPAAETPRRIAGTLARSVSRARPDPILELRPYGSFMRDVREIGRQIEEGTRAEREPATVQ